MEKKKTKKIEILNLPLSTEDVWSQADADPRLSAMIAKLKTGLNKTHVHVKRRRFNIIETEFNYHVAVYKEEDE